MNELEKQKKAITEQLRGLCAHCSNGIPHICKLQFLAREVSRLTGVPLIINDKFSGLLMAHTHF